MFLFLVFFVLQDQSKRALLSHFLSVCFLFLFHSPITFHPQNTLRLLFIQPFSVRFRAGRLCLVRGAQQHQHYTFNDCIPIDFCTIHTMYAAPVRSSLTVTRASLLTRSSLCLHSHLKPSRPAPSRLRRFSTTPTLESGHSKWSTIKHDKAKNDAQRNKTALKYAGQIAVAARRKSYYLQT